MRRGREIQCYYCTNGSKIVWTGERREFWCKSCEATNHLDEVLLFWREER